ncbi:hypothetical protein Salat_2113700 [Sesamum alatum]|uniref:Uncharacterized protein n=1 Tax=Sesamum alatum TaxID=300844 RepID=A0AAE1Y0P5_9LAMI|nr:hypothetical protein Salat_2113700 [Sesamum alatum]
MLLLPPRKLPSDATVDMLITPNSSWDVLRVWSEFAEVDLEKILLTRIQEEAADQWFWRYNEKGQAYPPRCRVGASFSGPRRCRRYCCLLGGAVTRCSDPSESSDDLNVEDWMRWAPKQLERVELVAFFTVCWSIWTNRNKCFFEGGGPDAQSLITQVVRSLRLAGVGV